MIFEKLKEQNYSVRKIATELKVNRSAVYQSARGKGSRVIRVKIASIIKQKPSQIWKDIDKMITVCDDLCYLEYMSKADDL